MEHGIPEEYRVVSVSDDEIILTPATTPEGAYSPEFLAAMQGSLENRTILNGGDTVTFVDAEEETVTALISVNEVDGIRNLEYAITCTSCSVANWIAVGTPPGDYRCTRCTWWLP